MSGVHKWCGTSDMALKCTRQPSSSALDPERQCYLLNNQVIGLLSFWYIGILMMMLLSSYQVVTSYQQSCYVVITTLTIKDPRLSSNVINNLVLHSLWIHSWTHSNTYLSIGVPFLGTLVIPPMEDTCKIDTGDHGAHSNDGLPYCQFAQDFGKYTW